MDELRFWEFVQHAHGKANGDMDEKCELIKSMISRLPKDDAKAFVDIFESVMDRAYSWPLWGAAYVINGERWLQ